jgi:hypothetical protein
MLRDERVRVFGGERSLAGDQLVQHHAEGIEIRPGIKRLAERLLGGHVRHGADHRPLAGELLLGRALALAKRGEEAEVTELCGAVRRQPDIAGLDIAMDDPVPVGVVQRAAHTLGDPQCQLESQGAAGRPLDQVVDGASVDVLLDDVGQVLLLAGVMDRDDVRMHR